MHSVQISPFAKKLSALIALTTQELEILERFNQRRKHFIAGQEIVHQGQQQPSTYLLASGWAYSYKIQPDGERQIIGFQIPGDFLGLRSLLMHKSDQSIEPLLDIHAVEIQLSDILESVAQAPRLATAILWAAARDEAIMAEHVVGIGRRDADERMAHFLLELCTRLTLVGLGSKAGYACPLTQYHLADALGMSPVHVNRVLRKLREDRMVTFRDGHVTFDDYNRLVGFAGFDPDYLGETGPLLS